MQSSEIVSDARFAADRNKPQTAAWLKRMLRTRRGYTPAVYHRHIIHAMDDIMPMPDGEYGPCMMRGQLRNLQRLERMQRLERAAKAAGHRKRAAIRAIIARHCIPLVPVALEPSMPDRLWFVSMSVVVDYWQNGIPLEPLQWPQWRVRRSKRTLPIGDHMALLSSRKARSKPSLAEYMLRNVMLANPTGLASSDIAVAVRWFREGGRLVDVVRRATRDPSYSRNKDEESIANYAAMLLFQYASDFGYQG